MIWCCYFACTYTVDRLSSEHSPMILVVTYDRVVVRAKVRPEYCIAYTSRTLVSAQTYTVRKQQSQSLTMAAIHGEPTLHAAHFRTQKAATSKPSSSAARSTALNDSRSQSQSQSHTPSTKAQSGSKACPTPSHNSHPSFHGRQLVGRRSESLYGAGNGGLSTEEVG